jgi:hypothetical protein
MPLTDRRGDDIRPHNWTDKTDKTKQPNARSSKKAK